MEGGVLSAFVGCGNFVRCSSGKELRMIKPRHLLLTLGVAATAIVLSLLASLWRSPVRPPTAVGSPPDLSAELAELRAEVQLLRRQLGTVARPQLAPAARDPAAPETAAPAAPPPTPEEVSARDRRRFEGLGRALAAEPVDRSWAPATERLIADTMNRPVFKGSKLLDATCHSTLCRLEVGHDSEADRRRFSSVLPTRLPSMPSGSMRNAEGPGRKTIVYVAREGHRIPREDMPRN
jgi:hypothetical protein